MPITKIREHWNWACPRTEKGGWGSKVPLSAGEEECLKVSFTCFGDSKSTYQLLMQCVLPAKTEAIGLRGEVSSPAPPPALVTSPTSPFKNPRSAPGNKGLGRGLLSY